MHIDTHLDIVWENQLTLQEPLSTIEHTQPNPMEEAINAVNVGICESTGVGSHSKCDSSYECSTSDEGNGILSDEISSNLGYITLVKSDMKLTDIDE